MSLTVKVEREIKTNSLSPFLCSFVLIFFLFILCGFFTDKMLLCTDKTLVRATANLTPALKAQSIQCLLRFTG